MHLIYTAWLGDRIGSTNEMIDVENDVSVNDLMDLLSEKSSQHAAIFRNKDVVKASLNGKVIGLNDIINNDSTITFFAPMAGG